MTRKQTVFLSAIILLSALAGIVVGERFVSAQSSRTPQTTPNSQTTSQKLWEYRVLSVDYEEALQRELTKLGEQGFELIQFQIQEQKTLDAEHNTFNFATKYVAILKRSKN